MTTASKKPAARQAATLLQDNQRTLAPLLKKLDTLHQLNANFLRLIDPALRPHCQVANYAEHRLVLAVPNGALATQLHFSVPQLLEKCKQDPLLRSIQTIQCKVQPSLFAKPTTPPLTVRLMISPQSASIIRAIAESITAPALKAALLRLATRTR